MARDPVLVVEDEQAQREALVDFMCRVGHAAQGVDSGHAATEAVARQPWSVMITDLRLPDMSGLDVIRRTREIDEEMGVLLVTAYASIASAVEALRLGAHDYLLKPLVLDEVAAKVDKLIQHRELVRDNARLRRALRSVTQEVDLVAVSPAMKEVMAWVRRVASSPSVVLVTGETGVGKEVVARAIHALGPGSSKPFQAVNIAALPETTVESELFGHERGAFTGADRRRDGLFRSAGNGTVLLDEIGELSLPMQAKLLRALDSREVRPLGSDTVVPFESRIIAVTNRDLQALVEAGRFREDLYFRLNVVHIHVPPLRERREDIPALCQALVARHAARWGVTPPVIASDAIRMLSQHAWRGNVRELSNVLERAMFLSDEGRIEPEHLPIEVAASGGTSLRLADAVDRFESAHIRLVLRLCGGNREKTARELDVSLATLYRKMERLAIKDA